MALNMECPGTKLWGRHGYRLYTWMQLLVLIDLAIAHAVACYLQKFCVHGQATNS